MYGSIAVSESHRRSPVMVGHGWTWWTVQYPSEQGNHHVKNTGEKFKLVSDSHAGSTVCMQTLQPVGRYIEQYSCFIYTTAPR